MKLNWCGLVNLKIIFPSVINLIKSSFISANKSLYSFNCLLNRWFQINILNNTLWHAVSYCQRISKNFAKFKGKRPSQSLLFNKFENLRSVTLLKKRLWRRYFRMNFAKFLRTSFCRAPASAFLIYEGAKKEKYVTCWSKLELKGFGANTQ